MALYDPKAVVSGRTSLAFALLLQEESSQTLVTSIASPVDSVLVTQADSVFLSRFPLEIRLIIYKRVVIEFVDRKWHIFWKHKRSSKLSPSAFTPCVWYHRICQNFLREGTSTGRLSCTGHIYCSMPTDRRKLGIAELLSSCRQM
jgi:hypothetical protein